MTMRISPRIEEEPSHIPTRPDVSESSSITGSTVGPSVKFASADGPSLEPENPRQTRMARSSKRMITMMRMVLVLRLISMVSSPTKKKADGAPSAQVF
jgi:hypothetical protein